MRWTSEQLAAYEARRAAAKNSPDDAGTPSELECSPRPEPLAASPAQETDSARYVVRYTSIRKRLCDEENIVTKFHTDALRYAGILPDDDPETAHFETRQRKCERGEPERIEIVIERLA